MVELAKIFGAKHDNVERDMKNVLDLEVRLAKVKGFVYNGFYKIKIEAQPFSSSDKFIAK